MSQQHPKSPYKFFCTVAECGKGFFRSLDAKQHRTKVHGKKRARAAAARRRRRTPELPERAGGGDDVRMTPAERMGDQLDEFMNVAGNQDQEFDWGGFDGDVYQPPEDLQQDEQQDEEPDRNSDQSPNRETPPHHEPRQRSTLAQEGELPVDTAYLHGVEIKAVRPKSTNNSDDWKPGETRHSPLPVNPFRPFDNYTDYTWARWMKKLGASRNNTNKFLKDVRDPRFNLEELSFPNAKRMEEKIAKGIEDEGVRWRAHEIPIERGDGKGTWKPVLWFKPIMEVLEKLIKRPEIAEHMQWVPQRLYTKDGEPIHYDFSNGKVFWDLHHEHDTEGFALPLHLYSDASKITTFRNIKVWPVHIWLENLPEKIRTKQEVIGSSLVGYIPVIDGLLGKQARQAPWFRQAKLYAYHQALGKIFEEVRLAGSSGKLFRCGDGKQRFGFPALGCISADLLELFEMFATRGTRGFFPCFACQVTRLEMMDLSTHFPNWTVEKRRELVARAKDLVENDRRTTAEEFMKRWSIHGILATVLDLPQATDVHRVVGNDCLHGQDSGTWGKHALPAILEIAGPEGRRILDERICSFPRFKGIRSFTSGITDAPWVEARAYRSLHAIVLCIGVGCLGEHSDILLMLIRFYAILSVFMSLRIITESQLEELDRVVERIEILGKRIRFVLGLNSGYPKFHMLSHLRKHIEEIATDFMTSTRRGEELHPVDHALYENTNKKDFMKQLLRQQDERDVLNRIEGRNSPAPIPAFSRVPPPPPPPRPKRVDANKSLESIRSWHENLHLRPNFPSEIKPHRDLFIYYLRSLLTTPSGAGMNVTESLSGLGYPRIFESDLLAHGLVHVPYNDLQTWEWTEDIINCSEKRGKGYDSIAYSRECDGKIQFGRLLSCFTIKSPQSFPPICYIQIYELRDRDPETFLPTLNVTASTTLIWLNDIIRCVSTPQVPAGSLLYRDYPYQLLYINEFADTDSYFRLNKVLPSPNNLTNDFFRELLKKLEQQSEEEDQGVAPPRNAELEMIVEEADAEQREEELNVLAIEEDEEDGVAG